MSKVLIVNHEGLIGDFLGTVPAMQEIAKRHGEVFVIHNDSVTGLFSLIREEYAMKRHLGENAFVSEKIYDINSTAAFQHASTRGLYMSDAYLSLLGFPVTNKPAKADLLIERKASVPSVDFVLAPFSRSLPLEQRWGRGRWQQLVLDLPECRFAILGSSKNDPMNYIHGKNVVNFYDNSFNDVADLLQKSRFGLISVVTGIAHLAFHINVQNYLLTNQGDTWGNNPDATKIRNDLTTLTTDELISFLNVKKR